MTSSDTLPRILIVDDTPDHVVALHGVLKTRYRTLVTMLAPARWSLPRMPRT